MAPPPTNISLVDGTTYIHTLTSYVRQHESKLAEYGRRRPTQTVPTWTTIFTLGVISSEIPVSPKPPLILRFDPHHLYYLLLKFDEARMGGSGGIGSLDVRIEGGPTRPMSVNYGNLALPSPGLLSLDNSDTASLKTTFSAVSTFSLGSGWWGTSPPPPDEAADVRYLYSSCTKLPALRLVPFTFTSTQSHASSSIPTLTKPVKDFQDCPPPNTAVPLYAFKNLTALILEELDPRGFLGWDVLSTQLRSLEVRRSGIEDIGELICDAVVEDIQRRKKGQGEVGEERRRRQDLNLSGESAETVPDLQASITDPSAYPVPPPYAWSRLRHLSLSHNSLTFVPSAPLIHLGNLTSLDLSSNLLISIPPGLAHLHSLSSLNLSDNMIESLLGVSKALGNVSVVNLSHNRIDNLSGLDRLFALERLDLRQNRLRESLEVSRLAALPCLLEVWIEGNPFSKPIAEGGEERSRVKCFGYFEREGKKGILLDGSLPGLGERRAIDHHLETKGHATGAPRRASAGGTLRSEEAWTAGAAKIVGRRVVTTPHSSRIVKGDDPASSESIRGGDPITAVTAEAGSPPGTPVRSKQKPRRRKPQRIVDLDGVNGSVSVAPSSQAGELSGTEAATSLGGLSDSDQAPSPLMNPTRSQPVRTGKAEEPIVSSAAYRHLRFPSSPVASSSSGGKFDDTTDHIGDALSGSVSLGASATKSGRRERVSPSLFEAPVSGEDAFTARGNGISAENSADAFRKKIEALRNEVGESWLSVLGEREMAAERSRSRGEESGTDTQAGKMTKDSKPVGGEVQGATVPVVKVVKGKKKRTSEGAL